MLPSDDREAAERLASEFAGTRAQLWWDGERSLGKQLAKTLELGPTQIAWDIYIGYLPSTRLDQVPRIFVHQMGKTAPEQYRGGRLHEGLAEVIEALR